jgi:hypothetical protein
MRGPVQIKTLPNLQKPQLFSIDPQALRAELLSHDVQSLYELEVRRADGLRCTDHALGSRSALWEWRVVFDIVEH